jgi:hypothetical protein
MSTIIAFLASTLGRWAVISGGVLAFVGAFAWHQQNVGARKAVAKIERQERKNVEKANRARGKSRDPRARGVRDPYSVDN